MTLTSISKSLNHFVTLQEKNANIDLNALVEVLRNDIEGFKKKTPYHFGYRQRMRLERTLFAILKEICFQKLNYNLNGFSKTDKDKIEGLILESKNGNKLSKIVTKIFRLKYFLQKLSTEDAYVRDETLGRLGITSSLIYPFIEKIIEGIRLEMANLHT